jgi:hypothetical protein
MKLWSIILVCAFCVGITPALWSQSSNETKLGILGYLDPKTGAFRPLPQNPAEDDEAVTPAAATTGKFVFVFTITIASTSLATDTIICTANTNVFESGLFLESASAKAAVKGSTATCAVTIPYSWPLKSASTDTVSLRYEVIASGAATAGGLPNRISSQSLPTIKVPANGATTTENIASTI